MSKKLRKFEKIGVPLLLVVWTCTYPVAVIGMLELISGIKYTPVSSFYTMGFFAVLYALPVLLYSLPKTLKATHQRQLTMPVLAGMLVPVVLACAPHYINLSLSDATVYEAAVPVERKSSQIRTPRGGDSYKAFRLHLSFQDVDIAGKKLNGEHIVYVSKETYHSLNPGDLFTLNLKKGPMAVFMIQTAGTKNIHR